MKKNLKAWLNNGWLAKHTTSKQEIQNLFRIIERDIVECYVVGSNDWRFSIAYNAALKCCLIPLYCEGYIPSKTGGGHYRAIQSLSLTLGNTFMDVGDYLEECRRKRNISDYDQVGLISEIEANELVKEVEDLHKEVVKWVRQNYPEYI